MSDSILAVNCSTCGASILVKDAFYFGEKVFCKEHEPCSGCWARRYGPYLNCMANDEYRETCQARSLRRQENE